MNITELKCAVAIGVVTVFVCSATACRNGSTTGRPEPARPGVVVPADPVPSTRPEASAPRVSPEVTPQAPGPSQPPDDRAPRKLAQDAADGLTCRVDADCAITCRSDGSCCLEQCGCSMPMSRSFLERLEAHLARECGPNPMCPVAGCVGTKLYEPRCQKGQCTAVKLPGGI